MKEIRYFIVTAKCGHVEKNKYVVKQLTCTAYSKKEAASIGRNLP